MHLFGYKKLGTFPVYEKCYRINNYYLMHTISSAEFLNVIDLRHYLNYVDKQKYKELLMHAITHDRFMTD
jgi:hypothetical protein